MRENPENEMERLDESESIEVSQSSDMKARVLLDIGAAMPHRFSRNNVTLPAVSAFQSQVLVRDLLKLGLFSMNIPSMASIGNSGARDGISFSRIPDALLGMAIHYAVTVSPTDPETPDDAPVILIDELERHVKRLEAHFGIIQIDMQVVSRVQQLAREAVTTPDLVAGRS